MIVVVW